MEEAGDLMSEQSQHIHFENTNRWSTKQLVTMALMCALGALFMYVQLPILPSAPFLTYDPSLVPAMVCGFAYGPGTFFYRLVNIRNIICRYIFGKLCIGRL